MGAQGRDGIQRKVASVEWACWRLEQGWLRGQVTKKSLCLAGCSAVMT